MKIFKPTLADLRAEAPLTTAEQALLDGCKTGKIVSLGEFPDEATDENSIRADLVRYLMLGGCEEARPHPKGVKISGAFVRDVLDLEHCKTPLSLALASCRFTDGPNLRDAELGQLLLSGSDLPSLDAQKMKVRGSVFLRHGFHAGGLVDISGSSILGQLICCGNFTGGKGIALRAEGLDVRDDIMLDQGFVASGLVDLTASRIGKNLNCTAGRFNGNGGPAILAPMLDVNGSILMSEGMVAVGLVDISGSKVGGQVDFSAGNFVGHEGTALRVQGLLVTGCVFLSEGFSASGTVDFSGAKVAQSIGCSGGGIEGGTGTALLCEGVVVDGDVLIFKDFKVSGDIAIHRAQIRGSLILENAQLNGVLFGPKMTVGGTLHWQRMAGKVGYIDLEGTHVGKLEDDRTSWDLADDIFLNGLTYDDLEPAMSSQERLKWLSKNTIKPHQNEKTRDFLGFNPQPYSQLASLLDRQGRRRWAAQVLFEREAKIRANEMKRVFQNWHGGVRPALRALWSVITYWVFDQSFRVLFGYGHKPMRALFWSVGLIVTAALFFGTIYDRGQMAPAAPVILASTAWQDAVENGCPVAQAPEYASAVAAGCQMPLALWEGRETGVPARAAADYESFNRWLYGADVFVPLVSLGQEEAWSPSRDRGAWGWWGFHTNWVFQVLGWLITALGAATLTGLVGRRD